MYPVPLSITHVGRCIFPRRPPAYVASSLQVDFAAEKKTHGCVVLPRQWLQARARDGVEMGMLVLGLSALVYTGVIALAMQSAIYYRPIPDYTGTGGPAGATQMRAIAVDSVPYALQVARFFALSVVAAACRVLLGVRNHVEIVQDAAYRSMLGYWRRRPRHVGLITVSNHVSSLDDPGLIAAITPVDVLLQPSKMRWSIATQDLVFPKGRNWIQAFMVR